MQELKEKAPVQSGNSDEGIYPNTTKGIDMSNSLTTRETASIKRDITVLNVKTPTPTEVDFALQFAAYSLRVNYCTKTQAYTKELEGTIYRFAGDMAVRPDHEEILVNIYVGATKHDFDILTIINVRYIREGYWNSIPWQEKVSPTTGEKFFKVSLSTSVLAFTDDESNEVIVPCREQGCKSNGSHHLTQSFDPDGYNHDGEAIHKEFYSIQLVKVPEETWVLDVETYDSMTPTQTASLCSDIQWLAAEAKKLNHNSLGR